MPTSDGQPAAQQEANQLFPWFSGTFIGLLEHIDNQNSSRASAVIGISTFLIAFGIPHIDAGASLSWNNTGWAIICLGSFLAITNAVLVFKPMVHNARQRLNLFYPGSYLGKLSRDEYVRKFRDLVADEKQLEEHFAKELYDYAAIVKSASLHLERAIVLFAIDVLAGAAILIFSAILSK